MQVYDVIVVGAGPAGCAAAYDLASNARSVLLIDHHDFPRVKPCAGALTVKTLNALRYPVSPVMRQVCHRSLMMKNSSHARSFAGRQSFCAMTVRWELDDFCLRKTIAAGAQFCRVAQWTDIEEAEDHVTIHTCQGPISAKFLIGADGANSQVRRFCGTSEWSWQGLALETNVPRNGQDFPMQFDFGVVEGGYGWIFPKRDHYNIGLYTYLPRVRLTRTDLAAYIARRMATDFEGAIMGHKIGFGGWNYHPRSNRIFLVGDAAGLVDTLLGEGIYNAVVSGQAAAVAIEHALRSGGSARALFGCRLRPIQRDAFACYRAARRFYGNIDFGYAALVSPIVRYSLVKGYTMGLTFSAICNGFLILPFFSWGRGILSTSVDLQEEPNRQAIPS